MHAKTDSADWTSIDIDTSWPPRSPKRPVYYVQSPSNHDAEKMSYGSSPSASPTHHYSPIQQSRESTTLRFSTSLKNPKSLLAWKHLQHLGQEEEEEEEVVVEVEDDGGRVGDAKNDRLHIILVFVFILLFTIFCLILYGAARAYKPQISVKSIVFENFYVQAGTDRSGVPTDMLSLNSTVRISFSNPATFFAVHVTSTPWELHYFHFNLASGQMKKFTQSRKSKRTIVNVVEGHQVPLYGGMPVLANVEEHPNTILVPLTLTFTIRSRAYILGRLVQTKFFRRSRCSVSLRGDKLGKALRLTDSCAYH